MEINFGEKKPKPLPYNYGEFPVEFWKRFMSKVDKEGPNGCWDWTDATWRFVWRYGRYLPSRLSYQMHIGNVPLELYVCHACDRGGICVNPDHLWVGTYYDNMKDMIQKERQTRGKISKEIILEAVRLHQDEGMKYKDIAERIGLSYNQVNEICKGITYSYYTQGKIKCS